MYLVQLQLVTYSNEVQLSSYSILLQQCILLLTFYFKFIIHLRNFFSAGSWDDVFKVSVALYIIGTLVWNFFATGEKVLE